MDFDIVNKVDILLLFENKTRNLTKMNNDRYLYSKQPQRDCFVRLVKSVNGTYKKQN